MGGVASAAGNIVNTVGTVASYPIEVIGSGVKEVGRLTGINEISNVGQTTQDVGRDDTFRNVLGATALAVGGGMAYNALSSPAAMAGDYSLSGALAPEEYFATSGGSAMSAYPTSAIPAFDLSTPGYGSPEEMFLASGGGTSGGMESQFLANAPSGSLFTPNEYGYYAYGQPGYGASNIPMTTGSGAITNAASQVGKDAAGGGITGWIKENPWKTAGIALLGTQLLGASAQQQSASDYLETQQDLINQAQANATQTWYDTAFPNEERMSAATALGTSNLAKKYSNLEQSLYEDLAARGMRGGYVAGAVSDLKQQQARDYSNLVNQLIEFENTPYTAPPILTAYPQAQQTQSVGERVSDLASSIAGTGTGLLGYGYLRKLYPDLF